MKLDGSPDACMHAHCWRQLVGAVGAGAGAATRGETNAPCLCIFLSTDYEAKASQDSVAASRHMLPYATICCCRMQQSHRLQSIAVAHFEI
jgi:hypothetical protein